MNSIFSQKNQTPSSILLLGTQIATGGAQKVLLDQAHWFHARGIKVTTAFFYDRDGLHKKWQDVSPFPVVNLSTFQKRQGMLRSSLSIMQGLWRLWKLLRREKFDVIETFTHDSNMLALPLAWMMHVPVRIATHHGIIAGIPRWREKLHAWMINNNIATCIVAVSAMTRQKLLGEGIQPGRVVVIQNGITPVSLAGVDRLQVRKEVGIGEDDPFLLAVGRLVYSKAHRVLIAAMPGVLKKFPNAKVGICGEGVMRTELEAQIRSLGLSDSVKLLGQSDNVTKFLASADVFMMPSLWEGLPIALLEAMSAGLPAIATRVEGVEEVIVEGEHGLLVPIENIEALANAILQLLADPQLGRSMGAAARKKVLESYTADRMCEQYLALMLK
jgi:glycosyltransferase involved in cell wall biosynthesis